MSTSEDFLIDTGCNSDPVPDTAIVYEAVSIAKENEEAKGSNRSGNKRPYIPNKRYHELEEFSGIKPGKLSRNLIEAVSVDRYEIPLFLYKMRSVGYPPGWLEMAKTGTDVSFSEDSSPSINSYDKNELISWPGFNAPWKYQHYDRYYQLNCKQISNSCSVDKLHESLIKKVRKKAKRELSKERKGIMKEIQQMESSLEKMKGENPGVSTETAIMVDEIIDVESIESAEKKELIEIESSAEPAVELIEEKAEEKAKASNENKNFLNIIGVVSDTLTMLPEETKLCELFKERVEPSISEKINSDNPVSKLPNLDNFSQNIMPVKNFEPIETNRTMYKNMIDLLRKRKGSLTQQK